MKTPLTVTILEMLKSWGAEIAVFLVGVALLVFLDASLVHAINLVHGNG